MVRVEGVKRSGASLHSTNRPADIQPGCVADTSLSHHPKKGTSMSEPRVLVASLFNGPGAARSQKAARRALGTSGRALLLVVLSCGALLGVGAVQASAAVIHEFEFSFNGSDVTDTPTGPFSDPGAEGLRSGRGCRLRLDSAAPSSTSSTPLARMPVFRLLVRPRRPGRFLWSYLGGRGRQLRSGHGRVQSGCVRGQHE